MWNRISAPKPQQMQSSSDRLKMFVSRRRRATALAPLPRRSARARFPGCRRGRGRRPRARRGPPRARRSRTCPSCSGPRPPPGPRTRRQRQCERETPAVSPSSASRRAPAGGAVPTTSGSAVIACATLSSSRCVGLRPLAGTAAFGAGGSSTAAPKLAASGASGRGSRVTRRRRARRGAHLVPRAQRPGGRRVDAQQHHLDSAHARAAGPRTRAGGRRAPRRGRSSARRCASGRSPAAAAPRRSGRSRPRPRRASARSPPAGRRRGARSASASARSSAASQPGSRSKSACSVAASCSGSKRACLTKTAAAPCIWASTTSSRPQRSIRATRSRTRLAAWRISVTTARRCPRSTCSRRSPAKPAEAAATARPRRPLTGIPSACVMPSEHAQLPRVVAAADREQHLARPRAARSSTALSR